MTEKKKLVELLDKIHHKNLGKEYDERLAKIADYLLENGVIVPLCKKGDKVWIVVTEKENNDWFILEDRVERFVRCDDYNFCFCLKRFGYIYIDRQTNDLDDALYDGCAYFTKEEAEKALAEKRADNG